MSADPQRLRSSDVADAVRARRLIAVLRRIEPRDRLLALVADLLDDGVRLFEVTLDGAAAVDDLAAVVALLAGRRGPDLEPAADRAFAGAGTVRTADQVRAAVESGADFAVSPVLDREVLDAAIAAGLPFVPGAYSPTEIDAAWRAGATFVKLFPASSLGTSHVRELRGPLPLIETIATGGVDASNAIAFIEAGAVAVGIGSAFGRMAAAERCALIAAIGRTGR